MVLPTLEGGKNSLPLYGLMFPFYWVIAYELEQVTSKPITERCFIRRLGDIAIIRDPNKGFSRSE